MNNLCLRTITGILYVGLIVGSVLLAPTTPVLFMLLMLFVGDFGTREWLHMARRESCRPQQNLPLSLVSMPLLFLFIPDVAALFFDEKMSLSRLLAVRHDVETYLVCLFVWVGLLAFPAVATMELFRKHGTDSPLHNLLASLLPCFWLGVPLAVLSISVRVIPSVVLALFIFVWLSDTLAYCVGSLLGKHKLCERISPKKTVEGFVGALVLTIALSALLPLIPYFNQFSRVEWMILAAIAVLLGTVGDLVESMLKRTCGVKDSGNVLPGHGGILDRFDSILFAAPVVLVFCLLFLQ